MCQTARADSRRLPSSATRRWVPRECHWVPLLYKWIAQGRDLSATAADRVGAINRRCRPGLRFAGIGAEASIARDIMVSMSGNRHIALQAVPDATRAHTLNSLIVILVPHVLAPGFSLKESLSADNHR